LLIVLLIAVPDFIRRRHEPLNITVMIIFFLPAPVAMGVHYVLKHAFRALW
jgi:hypothetical protein